MDGAVLRNIRVLLPGRILEGDLLVLERRVAGLGRVSVPPGLLERDLAGAAVLPGLIDLQVNGMNGVEVFGADAAGLRAIVTAAPRLGCTGLLLTQISAGLEHFGGLAAAMAHVGHTGARVLGVHVEGPYLNPAHPGAHPPEALRPPSRDEAAGILALLGDRTRLWTLAPELPGAEQIIELLGEAGVVAAAGHSGLAFDEARVWFGKGVAMVTHLFNAMSGLHHRTPGLAAAALADPRAWFSLIADGHHVHPAMVQLADRLGRDRLILVTDAVAPAGAADGSYRVAGQNVLAREGVVRLPDGTLAGSALAALDAVRNYALFAGLSLGEAAEAMTARPADVLGLPDLGRLHEGAHADFLVLDEEGELMETWVRGRPEYIRDRGGEGL